MLPTFFQVILPVLSSPLVVIIPLFYFLRFLVHPFVVPAWHLHSVLSVAQDHPSPQFLHQLVMPVPSALYSGLLSAHFHSFPVEFVVVCSCTMDVVRVVIGAAG